MIHRGEIYYADLSPVIGSEQGGYRPVVVLQNNKGNRYSTTIIVAPISSKLTKNPLPTHVMVENNYLEKKSVILLNPHCLSLLFCFNFFIISSFICFTYLII